jgi:ribosomal 30S subunit maturation factor RimM
VTAGLVALGEIVTTHGVAGWLKLNPYNLESPLLSALGEVILEKDGACATVEVESTRPHRRQILLKLRGIETIDGAHEWVGWTLCVKEEALERPAAGQYYHYRVIGRPREVNCTLLLAPIKNI